jgi:hypothetical protein
MLRNYQPYKPQNTEVVEEKVRIKKIKEIRKLISKYEIQKNELVLFN